MQESAYASIDNMHRPTQSMACICRRQCSNIK